MIHFREYIVVFAVAAVVTWLATFPVRGLARRHSLMVVPDPRRVHERPTPTGGGTAMFFGLLVAIAVASQMPAFAPVFRGNSAPLGVILAATVIFGVGMADDLREMSPPAKLAGQILAGTVLYLFGVNMIYFHVPLAETTLVLGNDWAPLATVLWVAIMANSVNFIDGLDGLAAGVVAIGAGAFFVYSHQLGVVGNITTSNAGPLIAVVTVGVCVGFLPHNFYPAKIFMGDSGAMLLGVLVAGSTLAVVGQDSYQFSGRTYFFFAPIIIPFFILGIPLLDTLFAIIRRAGKRTSPAVADLNHLHHRLMRLGHGHRQAVVLLWAWTALLSGFVLWPGVTNSHNEIPPIAVAALSILLYTLFAPRGRSGAGPENGQRAGKGRRGVAGRPPMAQVAEAGGVARLAAVPPADDGDATNPGAPSAPAAAQGVRRSSVRLLPPVAEAGAGARVPRPGPTGAPQVAHPAPPVARPAGARRLAANRPAEAGGRPALPSPGAHVQPPGP